MSAAEFSEQILDSPQDVDTWETTGVPPPFADELDSMLPQSYRVARDESRAAVIVTRVPDSQPSTGIKREVDRHLP